MKIHSAFFVRKSSYINKIDISDVLFSGLEPSITKDTEILPEMEFTFDPSVIDNSVMPKRIFKSKKRELKILQIDLLISFEENSIISKEIRYRQPEIEKDKNNFIKITTPKKFKWNYTPKSQKQLQNWYNDTVKEGMSGFVDYNDFESWYNLFVADKCCKYCGLKERDCQELIHNGVLTSLRFPIYNVTSRGVNRGYWLEIDKKDPKGIYSRENCNPSCYFCNNDKSDAFSDEEYQEIMEKGRKEFISKLISKING